MLVIIQSYLFDTNMIRFAFIVFLNIVACNQVFAQRYTSFYTPHGQIFFFKPHTIAGKRNHMKFEYDMTYKENNDSIIFNFSVITTAPIGVNGFAIKNTTLAIVPLSFKRLYIDLHKRKYTTRMQVSFRFSELKNIMTCIDPYHFEVMTNEGELLRFEDSESDWRKENKRMTEVFNLTTINN